MPPWEATIGYSPYLPAYRFYGTLGEVRVYDVALGTSTTPTLSAATAAQGGAKNIVSVGLPPS